MADRNQWGEYLNIIDTSGEWLSAFEGDHFDLAKWDTYIDRNVPGAKGLCLDDMRECMGAGFTWGKDFLPVLNAVQHNPEQRETAVRSFLGVTENLDRKIQERFGRTVDCDVILYLGLCNGAGWVTTLNGKTVVLLGIEKIMELNWQDTDAMTGLIIHELGHVYQDQYGVLHRETGSTRDKFLWQLFTEGIAMVFEQEIAGDPDYFHQDTNGWKDWCDRHAGQIRESFRSDLETMTQANQRYFGDWASYEGYGDTGYYLGTRFVRFLLESECFDRLISWSIEDVRDGFERFAQ